jgi:uncharacterized membrane protein
VLRQTGAVARTAPGALSAPARRLVGVDAARGLALVGMVTVHVLPAEAADGSTTTAHLLAAGRSAATFAVVAGVGLALATGRTRPPGGTVRGWLSAGIGVRAVLLAAVGLLLGELDSGIAVILTYYGVLFLCALPVLGLGPRPLLALAAGVAVVVPVLSQLVRAHLPPPSFLLPTTGRLLREPGALLPELLLTGYYPVLSWTAYLFLGLAVGRLALERARVALRLLLAGAALAVAATAVSALLLGPLGGHDALRDVVDVPPGAGVEDVVAADRFGTVPVSSPWWLATDAPHSTTPPDLLATGGVALAVLGAALLLARRVPQLLLPLAAMGGMPLTLYSVHVTVVSLTRAADPTRSWAVQLAAYAVLAVLWRRLVGRGPLEALLAAAVRAVTGAGRRTALPTVT